MNKPKQVFPRWVWVVYSLLFSLSIPWYLPKSIEMKLILGLPFWLIACIVAILLTACFTSWIIHRYWTEEIPDQL